MFKQLTSILAPLFVYCVVGCSRNQPPANASPPCNVSKATAGAGATLAAAVSGGRRPPPAELADLAVATVAVRAGGACAVATAVSYGNGSGGGVAIYRDNAALAEGDFLSLQTFPGAERPLAAGADRVGFSYRDGDGSGYRAERTTVLCALDEAAWIPCATVTTAVQAGAAGTAAGGSGPLASFNLRSTTEVHGDTLVIEGVTSWLSAGQHGGKIDTTVSHLILPHRTDNHP